MICTKNTRSTINSIKKQVDLELGFTRLWKTIGKYKLQGRFKKMNSILRSVFNSRCSESSLSPNQTSQMNLCAVWVFVEFCR